jgi:adenine-specific DNA-methyltransferase
MSKEILQDIITDFKVDKFISFFRHKNRSFRPQRETLTQYDDEFFSEGIKIGEVSFDNEARDFIICAFYSIKSLSERSGKKAQYEKAKKILKEIGFDGGIFIFYDKAGNFRFSLIYANYMGKHRDWSTFRRFTYFVGKELTNKTFLQRVGNGDFTSLEKIKEAFSVEKVTKEFYEDIAHWYFWAVEYSRFPKDAQMEENGKNVAVIRLITRMIFIWFMRERGLVPKELFEERNIKQILKNISPDSSTYYRAILQNLFFATLNTKKEERQFRSEKRFYKGWNKDFGIQYVYRYHDLFTGPEKIEEYFGNIPFLNGGLFDCLDDGKNDIYIDGFTERNKEYQPEVPNYLFFSREKKVDLGSYYGTKNKFYKAQGLLNILSSFNFTIDENSPDDADIALDPELLGRVFENLLASFNPETSTTARKATGSYYTPREIVDYMVTESLKAYFKTHLQTVQSIEEKLDNLFSTESEENPFSKQESKKLVELIESVRIIDPAVGSGAFPMGALNKMVFILSKVDFGNELWKQAQLIAAEAIPDPQVRRATKNQIEEFFKDKNADYGRKLYLIQKCIYGVDIQQIAVEIAKLRFFISLLVDEKIDKEKENWGIEPLPNLDFKIMQGNSLISEFFGIDFDNGQTKQEQAGVLFIKKEDKLIKEFEQKKIDFQNEPNKDKKAKLKNEIEDLMIKIFEAKIREQKADYFRQMEDIKGKYAAVPNKKTREEIIDKEKRKLSRKAGFDLENIERQLREFTSKNKTKPFFAWKLYFAEVFEKNGFDIVIANPPYVNIEKIDDSIKKSIHRFKTAFQKYDLYILFYEKSISILKEEGVLTFISSNKFLSQGYGFLLRKYLLKFKINIIISFNFNVFESAVVRTCIFQLTKKEPRDNKIKIIDVNNINDKYKFLTKKYKYLDQEVFEKTEENNFRINLTNQKIKLLDKIKKDCLRIEDICSVNYGLRPSSEKIDKKKSYFIKNSNPDGKYKKYFEGKDMGYWRVKKNYFIDYRPDVMYNPMFIELFKNEKLVGLRTLSDINKLRFIYDNEGLFCNDSVVVLTHWYLFRDIDYITVKRNITEEKIKISKRYSVKYLQSILNSKLIKFYVNELLYDGTHFYPDHMKSLPVKILEENKQKLFIDLVDKILAITCRPGYDPKNLPEEQKELEKQIDQLVYNLYGLTPEEIKIVEGK